MKTKQTLFAIAIVSLFAACATNEEMAQPDATGDKPVTASPTPHKASPPAAA